MAWILARASPELRLRLALRACTRECLVANEARLLRFEVAVKNDLRLLRLTRRKYTHSAISKTVATLIRRQDFAFVTIANFASHLRLSKRARFCRRKLQLSASRYMQNVTRILHTHHLDEQNLSIANVTSFVHESLLLRWLLSNEFGSAPSTRRALSFF